MKKKMMSWQLLLSCAGMMCLILDSRCVAEAAAQAVSQCLSAVIPSLFPLFVICNYALPMLAQCRIPWLCRFCKIPQGCESILVLGSLGGFPVAAQCICQTDLPQKDAERMLGFCSNCGPAFLFGIIGGFFEDRSIPLVLMVIQLLSALLVAHVWGGEPARSGIPHIKLMSLAESVQRAIRSMAAVCAWIILGNVLLLFAKRWFFPFFSPLLGIILSGLTELTNGCFMLPQISDIHIRFIAASGFVCFGGLCVMLQVHAMVAGNGLSMKAYFGQKLLQGAIGVLMAALYGEIGILSLPLVFLVGILAKLAVEKMSLMLYNNAGKGGIAHAVSQTDRKIV